MKEETYIDFMVAPYALPEVCEALYNNGVKDACITKEDDELHIRWKYDVNRFIPSSYRAKDCNGVNNQNN